MHEREGRAGDVLGHTEPAAYRAGKARLARPQLTRQSDDERRRHGSSEPLPPLDELRLIEREMTMTGERRNEAGGRVRHSTTPAPTSGTGPAHRSLGARVA